MPAVTRLTGVAFNDLVNDDKRYYTMNNPGPTNTLIALPSTHRGLFPRLREVAAM